VIVGVPTASAEVIEGGWIVSGLGVIVGVGTDWALAIDGIEIVSGLGVIVGVGTDSAEVMLFGLSVMT
jgi:hypothetical protein